MPKFEGPPKPGELACALPEATLPDRIAKSLTQTEKRRITKTLIDAHEEIIRALLRATAGKQSVSAHEAFDQALQVSEAWKVAILRAIGVTDEEFESVLNDSNPPGRDVQGS